MIPKHITKPLAKLGTRIEAMEKEIYTVEIKYRSTKSIEVMAPNALEARIRALQRLDNAVGNCDLESVAVFDEKGQPCNIDAARSVGIVGVTPEGCDE